MPIKHLNIWRKYLPDAMFVNLYGPTEITCNCTYYRIDREFQPGDVLPIGKAFPNEKVFLLDEENHLIMQKGVNGEICVAGSALALGYYRNPEQTRKAFVQNPLNNRYLRARFTVPEIWLFIMREASCVLLPGRIFRSSIWGTGLNLGKLKMQWIRYPRSAEVCAFMTRIRIRLLRSMREIFDRRTLSRSLLQHIPGFMVPNVFMQIEKMPLTKNGKIDRKELSERYQKR